MQVSVSDIDIMGDIDEGVIDLEGGEAHKPRHFFEPKTLMADKRLKSNQLKNCTTSYLEIKLS